MIEIIVFLTSNHKRFLIVLDANYDSDYIALISSFFQRFSDMSCDCLYINAENSFTYNHGNYRRAPPSHPHPLSHFTWFQLPTLNCSQKY